MTMLRQVRALLVSFFALSVSSLAYAQSAQVQGLVTDSSGAVIAKASVRVVDQKTGTVRITQTNESGTYAAPGLNPSLYKVFVQAPGFSSAISTPITLNVAQDAVLNFELRVGKDATEVVVNADNLDVNTTDGSVSTVVDRQFVENLPLNGRSFQSLLYLSPGVTPNVSSANNYYSQGQFVVNGQRGDANYWMVDGVSGNVGMSAVVPGAGLSGAIGATNLLGGTSALVSVDALQEFRIATSTYSPEFGRVPGGQISIQTRSGSNQFHGTLFDYLRNTDLDATDWFADHDGLPKAAEIQNDFGGVLGGPILKDKTFFFFSYEGLRVRQPVTYLATVPDMAARMAAIPAMRPYLDAYPLPEPGAAEACPGCGYVAYSATFSNPASADAFSLRIDHQRAKNLSFFARYSHAPSSIEQRGAGFAANVINAGRSVTKTATVGATWAQSTQVVNDARFNYSVGGGVQGQTTDSFGGGTPLPTAGLLASPYTLQNSEIIIGPAFGTNMDEIAGLEAANFQHQFNVVDTLSVQSGSHSLKFGIDYRRLSPSYGFAKEQLVPIFGAATPTGNIVSLETGNPEFTEVVQNGEGTLLLHNLSLFGQDTWRVASRLNLTYGLRWDVDFLPTAETGPPLYAVNGFSLGSLANLALAPAGTPAYGTRYGKIAPRIGGAYRISNNPDRGLVLRGGFGVFYNLVSNEVGNASIAHEYYPYGAFSLYNVPFPTVPQDAPVPAIVPPNIANGETLFGLDPKLDVPYALQWNVALEQSLGTAQNISLSYIGASDKHLLASEYVNNPNQNYASADLIGNTGSSNYQALQVQLQRQLTNGLQALISYNWSHSIDTGSYGGYTNGTLVDQNANRGDSDFDIRHALSAAVSYIIPALNLNLATRAVTGGWSLHNVVQIHSGPPVDVNDANFSALTEVNSTVLIRPDVVSGQPLYLSGAQYPGNKALNPAAFADPPMDPSTQLPLRQGDLERNVLRARGLAQWDCAIHREFSIRESVKLQFRAELFNGLNHPNFGPYNTTFQTGNILFGQSTAMLDQYLGGGGYSGTSGQNPLYSPGGPRSGELALKLVF